MWIRSRKVVAQWLGQHSSDENADETPVAQPEPCDCGSPHHTRADCPGIVHAGQTESTWRSGGNPDGSSGSGPTFDAGEDFWRRFRGE